VQNRSKNKGCKIAQLAKDRGKSATKPKKIVMGSCRTSFVILAVALAR